MAATRTQVYLTEEEGAAFLAALEA